MKLICVLIAKHTGPFMSAFCDFVDPIKAEQTRAMESLPIISVRYFGSNGLLLQKFYGDSSLPTEHRSLQRTLDLWGEAQVLNILQNSDNEISLTQKEPKESSLNIVFADQDMLVINKPAKLLTPPWGERKGKSLMNQLLYYFPQLDELPQTGLCHRLDRDTNGLLVIARNFATLVHLINKMRTHDFQREYKAMLMR